MRRLLVVAAVLLAPPSRADPAAGASEPPRALQLSRATARPSLGLPAYPISGPEAARSPGPSLPLQPSSAGPPAFARTSTFAARARASAPTAARAPEVALAILSPAPGVPVFGEVEVVVEVAAGTVRTVELSVDGRKVGERSAPPFSWRVDVGQENAPHRFEALARGDGGSARAVVETPALRVDLEVEVELQQLYVSVTRDGEAVADLAAEDFRVVDDGEPQELVTFGRGDVPLTALLLVDASDSMRGRRLATALGGVRRFLAELQPLDQAKLLLFADRVVHETPTSSFAEVLSAGLEAIEAGGGTALNDHLFLALEELGARSGRRVVILLSDGVDTASVLGMAQVLDTVRRSSAQIYWLRSGAAAGRHSSAWRSAAEHAEELRLLEEAVTASGGRILPLPDVAASASAFAAILDELRRQYVLGYYPSRDRGDGRWHPVRVRLRRRGVEVRTAAGYFDF